MKKRFDKLKDKLDLKKFKDKIDNLGLLKSKLDKLKDKLDDLDNSETEDNLTIKKPINEDLIREKYKSLRLLGKTKQILGEYDILDDDYLAPGDLDELQSDLAHIYTEIKEEEKKEAQWEEIKTSFTLESEPKQVNKLIRLQEYWRSEFNTLLTKYSEEYTLYEVSKFSNTHLKLKFPLLARLIEKIKTFNEENDILLLL